MKLMQTRSLTSLVEISKVGSFAEAASRLNMTLSALSMQMKTLERELGVALFDRAFRPPRLTPVGRSVCQHAVRVLSAQDLLEAACRPDDRLLGCYRIGFVSTASVRLLPGFLANARRQAPRAMFEIVSGLSEVLEEQVCAGRLDAAVVSASPAGRPGLEYDLLCEEPLVYAVPETVSTLPLQAVAERLPFLQFTPSSGVGKLISDFAASSGLQPEQRIVLDSVEAIMECVKNGLGFTFLPRPDIERYSNAEVAVITPETNACSRQLVLVTAAGRGQDGHPSLIRTLF